MIARVIAIVIIKIASMVEANMIKKQIIILNQTMVPKRKLMPCIWMLTTKQAVLAREALWPPPST